MAKKKPSAAKPVKPEITSDRISPETIVKINVHMRAVTGSAAVEWRKPIYLDSVIVAGPATVYVTSHQGALIARLQALRSALWPVVDPHTAAAFSMASARAWTTGATSGPLAISSGHTALAQRLHALAAVVHELETRLGEEAYTWRGAIDAYQAAKTLAFDLAVEAGRVDHQEHAEGPGAVVLPPPAGPAVAAEE